MSDFLKLLKELIGEDVNLHFYTGDSNVFIPDDEKYLFQGTIEDICGSVLKFKHSKSEQMYIDAEKTYLNLEQVSIWAVDIPTRKGKVKMDYDRKFAEGQRILDTVVFHEDSDDRTG